jgi:hypothetical protein
VLGCGSGETGLPAPLGGNGGLLSPLCLVPNQIQLRLCFESTLGKPTELALRESILYSSAFRDWFSCCHFLFANTLHRRMWTSQGVGV